MSDDFKRAMRTDTLIRIIERPCREEERVAELGKDIGYGRIMQLCEQLWGRAISRRGVPSGGEHTVGPCATFMVPCQCVVDGDPELDPSGHCEWCCGVKRVTEHVRMVQRKTMDAHV